MTHVEVIDVDFDTHPDIVTSGDSQIGVVLGDPNGNGVISAFHHLYSLVGGVTEHLAVGDFNGDGFGDAVVSHKPGPGDAARMAFGAANGQFASDIIIQHAGAQHGLAVGDFTPLGVAADLITVRLDSAIVWQWDGDSLEMAKTVTLPTSQPVLRAVSGRLDAGASDDFAIASIDGIVVFEQVQPGDFVSRSIAGTAGDPEELALATGNLDGSGADELVTVVKSAAGDQDIVILADGGRGVSRNLLSTPFFPDNAAIGDVDRDGNLDVITSGLTGVVLVFYGDGAGGFPCRQEVALLTEPGWVATGSFDLVPQLELIAAAPQGVSWIISNN